MTPTTYARLFDWTILTSALAVYLLIILGLVDERRRAHRKARYLAEHQKAQADAQWIAQVEMWRETVEIRDTELAHAEAERDAEVAQRDAARSDRDAALAEAGDLRGAVSGAQATFDLVAAQRDGATAECARIANERDDAVRHRTRMCQREQAMGRTASAESKKRRAAEQAHANLRAHVNKCRKNRKAM